MHASVRRYRVRDIDALVSKVEDEFVEQVKEIDGFVGYYVIDGDDGTAASVTVGDNAHGRGRLGPPRGRPGCARARATSWTAIPRSPSARCASAPRRTSASVRGARRSR